MFLAHTRDDSFSSFYSSCRKRPSPVFAPLVLAPDLFFFLRSEIVFDICERARLTPTNAREHQRLRSTERLADFIRRLALDHVGDRFARGVEQRLDVQVVRGENEPEQRDLVDIAEVRVPLTELAGGPSIRFLAGSVVFRMLVMVLAELENLL